MLQSRGVCDSHEIKQEVVISWHICAGASLLVHVITAQRGTHRSRCQVRLYKATADVGGLRHLISNNVSGGLMNLRQC